MAKLPSRLRRLDDALADLPGDEEPMLLTELDGFLTGVVVCPALVVPGEWLPRIWGDDGAPFDDAADVQQFARMLTAHHKEIIRRLDRGRFQPIYDIDERNGDVLWELWIDGFGAAMTLRPDCWPAITGSDDAAAATALAGMITLVDIAGDRCLLHADAVDELTAEAPGRIRAWVAALHAWRIEHHRALDSPERRPAKMGRNDPCSCGSVKKYKRCCGG